MCIRQIAAAFGFALSLAGLAADAQAAGIDDQGAPTISKTSPARR